MDGSGAKPAGLIPVLKEMRELLLKYDFIEHADHVSRLIDLANLESPDLVGQFLYGGVWSGAGSLADAQFSGNVMGRPTSELYSDDMEHHRLLVRLAAEMSPLGIHDEWIESLAKGMHEYVEEFDRRRGDPGEG